MENPKIRFKGFTKDWEQRKLIDYLEVSSEKNRDNRFTKDDVLSVSGEYGIVNQIEFQGRSFAGASVSNYGVVENGDVVYTKSPLKSNPYGIIKTNKGIPGIVSTLYAVYKPKEITDSKFVQIYFELDSRMNSYMHPLVNKGAKNDMKVSAENALKGMVSFPKKDEQEMISLYFSNLDHLITLHQRKCEQTKNLKKYMLQKMFPQNGAKVPEIRFNGFTHDWEQRKLIDYLEVSSEKNRDNRFTKDDVLSVSGEYGIVNQIEFQGRSFAGASVSNYGVVENGDVVYTKSPLKSNPYGIIKTNKGIPGIVSTLYAVYKPKEITDSKFVQIYFELDSRMNSYMHPLVNKGAKNDMKVSAENALKGMVSFPKKDEQEMISLYFSNLDHLITLHQRKCEQTKNLKKYMLQKMFPQNGAKVPEIRFNGFTHDWEQRKFSDIASRESVSRESSYDLPSLEYEDVIAEEGRLNKDISLKENIKKGIVFDGSQVLYGKLRPYLHNWLNPDFSGVAVGDWWVLKPNNADKSFIYRLIQTQRFDDIANQSAGSKMPRADWNLVSNTEFAVPVSQEEQEKIGEYFSSLDHLITLHQRKCDELKKMKKFMLQNMFI